jgi:hypothetical protein
MAKKNIRFCGNQNFVTVSTKFRLFCVILGWLNLCHLSTRYFYKTCVVLSSYVLSTTEVPVRSQAKPLIILMCNVARDSFLISDFRVPCRGLYIDSPY